MPVEHKMATMDLIGYGSVQDREVHVIGLRLTDPVMTTRVAIALFQSKNCAKGLPVSRTELIINRSIEALALTQIGQRPDINGCFVL